MVDIVINAEEPFCTQGNDISSRYGMQLQSTASSGCNCVNVKVG